MKRCKVLLSIIVTSVIWAVFISSSQVSATIYSLRDDWSITTNPNGVWSYNQGSNLLPLAHNWAYSGHDVWANASSGKGHIPAIWQAWLATGNYEIDDILVHDYDSASGLSYGEVNIKWTSNIDGVATISGGVWWADDTNQRNSDWKLYINDELITGGHVSYNDPYDRDNPFNFADGSGGESVLTFNTLIGDVVKLELVKGATSPYGGTTAVDFNINAAPVPLPSTLLLLSSSLLGLIGIRRRV